MLVKKSASSLINQREYEGLEKQIAGADKSAFKVLSSAKKQIIEILESTLVGLDLSDIRSAEELKTLHKDLLKNLEDENYSSVGLLYSELNYFFKRDVLNAFREGLMKAFEKRSKEF